MIPMLMNRRFRRRYLHLVGALSLAALLAGCGEESSVRRSTPTPAATPTATATPSALQLSGMVTDAQLKSLGGVSVTASDAVLHRSVSVFTAADGSFRFPAL